MGYIFKEGSPICADKILVNLLIYRNRTASLRPLNYWINRIPFDALVDLHERTEVKLGQQSFMINERILKELRVYKLESKEECGLCGSKMLYGFPNCVYCGNESKNRFGIENFISLMRFDDYGNIGFIVANEHNLSMDELMFLKGSADYRLVWPCS